MAIPSLTSPAMLAVQEKVQTLQKQGVPMGQISQILQNEVLPTGSVPISQLWQLMQYVKSNAAQTQAPPTDSVAMQLARQVQQVNAQKHPMAQQGGVPPTHPVSPVAQGGPPAGPPPAAPPPGVAGLPQNKVGQPGAYAVGGIVAFDDGGQAQAPQISPAQQDLIQRQMIAAMRQRQAVDAPAHPIMNPGMASGGAVKHFADAGPVNLQTGSDQPPSDYSIMPFLNGLGQQWNQANQRLYPGTPSIADSMRTPGALAAQQKYGNSVQALQPQPQQPTTPPAGPTGPQNFGAALQARQAGNPAGLAGLAPPGQQRPPGSIPASLGAQPSLGGAAAPSSGGITNAGVTPTTSGGSMGGASVTSHVSSLPGVLRNGPVLDQLGQLMDKAEKPETVDQVIDRVWAAAQKHGAGAAVKEFDQFLDRDQAQLEKNTDYGKKIALANAGFAMAERASLRGGDPGYGGGFMGALAAGGGQLAKDLIANKDKAQAAQQNIAKLRFEAAHAAEGDVLGVVKDSVLEARAQAQQYHASMQAGAALMVEAMKAKAQLHHDDAFMRMYGSKPGSALNDMQQHYSDAVATGNKAEMAKWEGGIRALEGTMPTVQSAEARVTGQQGIAALKDTGTLDMMIQLEKDPAKRQELIDRRTQIQSGLFAGAGGGGGSGAPMTLDSWLTKQGY